MRQKIQNHFLKFSIQTINNRPCHGFDAILTREVITREKLQFLYENVMSNNFRRTVVLNIYIYISTTEKSKHSRPIYIYIYIHCKLKLHSTVAHNGNTQISIILLHYISQYTNIFIGCAGIFTSTMKYTPVQQYCIPVQKC